MPQGTCSHTRFSTVAALRLFRGDTHPLPLSQTAGIFLKEKKMAPDDRGKLLRIKDAAEILGWGEIGFRRFIERGGLKTVRIGRRVFLRREDVEGLANNGSPKEPNNE